MPRVFYALFFKSVFSHSITRPNGYELFELDRDLS